MDDVLIYGESEEEHDKNLKEVLSVIKKYNIPLNKEKSVFGKKELEFLGYHISQEGIRQTDERIEVIKNLRAPRTKEELQSLLGLITYVSKFIPHLATITEPLRSLLKNENRFIWKKEHEKILNDIKEWMTKSKHLGFFKSNDKTQVKIR